MAEKSKGQGKRQSNSGQGRRNSGSESGKNKTLPAAVRLVKT